MKTLLILLFLTLISISCTRYIYVYPSILKNVQDSITLKKTVRDKIPAYTGGSSFKYDVLYKGNIFIEGNIYKIGSDTILIR